MPPRDSPHEFTTLSSLFLTLIVSSFFLISPTRAQLPAFKFINQGEFGDRITEYGASYRAIQTDGNTFSTFPFRLCFYNTTPNAYVLAIRAGVPTDESLMRWVWDANRDHPVRENAHLSLGKDGNLVLAEEDGQVVWQTNTAKKGVTGIKLLPNGIIMW